MEIYDCIEFQINGKIRKIELCLGDITKLSIEDSVDLLLLSAFQNNYMTVKGSLIGALSDNLNLSVKALAKDKAEDLRTHFNCWISKELSPHLPFRRILCLEQGFSSSIREDPTNLVASMFRALFTTFKNNEWSMMTPILATGSQMSDKSKMLNEMVRGGSAWIMAEMPLSCMKIVIYRGKPTTKLGKDDNQAIEEFMRLKSEINWKPFKNITLIRYDALFLFVKEDEESVNIFLELLRGLFNEQLVNIKLKCLNRKIIPIRSTNYDIYEKYQIKMLESRKVGLFLSNDFLEYPKAIEVYNLALCLTQKSKKSLLTPICLKRLNDLPEYMSLNQWIDCRIKDGEMKIQEQLQGGAKCFFQILAETLKLSSQDNSEANSSDSNKISIEQESINFNYDIFISYSHKDRTKCQMILKLLELSLPNARIFYDKNDIKTGFSWQEIIYNSLNGSKIVVALISENYIQSSMCREEFNIALSQDWSIQFETKLFPIWISDKNVQSIITDYPEHFSKSFVMNKIFVANILKSTSESLSLETQLIALFHFILNNILCPLLSGSKIDDYYSNTFSADFVESGVKARSLFFTQTWNLKEQFSLIPIKNELMNFKGTSNKTNDIAIGYHIDDSCYAEYLKNSILKTNKELKIIFCSMGHKSNEWQCSKDIETAYAIIILLKPYYVTNKSCRDQLHIALSLQRKYGDSGPIVIPIILETLPQNPSYIHLLQSRFKADDEVYLNNTKKLNYSNQSQGQLKIGFTHDSRVTKRMAVMLTFVSHWVSERIFVKSVFNPPKSFIIYSTFDLINTGFNVPELADIVIATKQIKVINISQSDVDLATNFLSKHYNNNAGESLHTICENPKELNQFSGKEQSYVKSHSVTKVCNVM